MIILGIDPGSNITGYGIINKSGNTISHIDNGCIRPKGDLPLYKKLTHIHDGLKKASQQFLDKSKHHLGDHTIQTLVAEGDCAESILISAKDLHVDIIVMGSHSRKWLENIVMGSVTEKVLRHTTVPLFIVPTKKHK